jgi:hypothetical protein
VKCRNVSPEDVPKPTECRKADRDVPRTPITYLADRLVVGHGPLLGWFSTPFLDLRPLFWALFARVLDVHLCTVFTSLW